MKNISKENKKRLTSVIASVIWAATVLTGCPHTVTPEPGPENPMWPQTIEQEDKTVVEALSTATFEDSINSMQTILNILDKYKDDPVVKQYADILNKVKTALDADDVRSLSNAINGEDVAKLTKLPESAKKVKEEREIEISDANSTLFPEQYDNAVAKKEIYDNYKNGQYAAAWDTYESAYNTYSAAYGNKENPADGTYLKAYNTYEGAYNTYKNSLGALPRVEYNKLVEFAKNVVEDFKSKDVYGEEYMLDGEYLESFKNDKGEFDKNKLSALINAAKDEANDQKASRDAALATYNTAKDEFVNGAENDFRTAQNTLNGKEAIFESKQSNLDEKYNDAVAAKQAYDNAAQGVKNLTVGDNVENMDFTGATYVQLSIPANAQSVDVFAFIETWQAIKNKIGDNSNVTLVENYNNQPFNIDFAAKEAAGKSNTDLLNEYYTMYVQYKLTSSDVGEVVRTELIPGVEIVTFMDRWDDIDDKPWEFVNAFSVSRETKVQMPQNYSLSGTYKSGIIGDNVTLKNLDSNTNISGNVRGKESFSSVYDLFVKNQEDVSKLPNMNVEFIRNNLGEDSNIYGYNIDTLIKKYYDNNKGSKLILNFFTSAVFDAREYLNGGSMYEGNNYKNNAYPLDINAALVMGSSIKNVKIEGTKKTNKNKLSYLTNVYILSSMEGIDAGCCFGVVDFMGKAPASVYGTSSFITFEEVSNTVNVQGGLGYVDATALSQTQANYIGNNGNNYYVRKLAKQSSVTFPGADVRQGIFTSIDGFGITKQQVEQNTNENKDDPLEVSKVLPRDIKQSKMDLMRNILEDNQKQYS